MWNLKRKSYIQRTDWWSPEVGVGWVGEMGEGSQMVQSWGYNA